VELNIRLFMLQETFNNQTTLLLQAVRSVCKFDVSTSISAEEASAVHIVSTTDAKCPRKSADCIQIDVKIQAASIEHKKNLFERFSRDTLKEALYLMSNTAQRRSASCTDSGQTCGDHKRGDTLYCQRFHSDSVCDESGRCVVPASCDVAQADRRASLTNIPTVESFEVCPSRCGACPPGKYGKSAKSCTNCPGGTYWNENENSTSMKDTCSLCPAGKYSTTKGGTSIAVCIICPKYSSSPKGSSSVCACSSPDASLKPIIFEASSSSSSSSSSSFVDVDIVVSGLGSLVMTTNGQEPDCTDKDSATLLYRESLYSKQTIIVKAKVCCDTWESDIATKIFSVESSWLSGAVSLRGAILPFTAHICIQLMVLSLIYIH